MADSNRRHGALRYRLNFQKRADVADGWGGTVPGSGGFTTQFTLDAHLRPLRGTETVMAARLEGRQPYVATVRAVPGVDAVTSSWRLVDARNANRVLAIISAPVDPDGKNQWREILVTDGQQS